MHIMYVTLRWEAIILLCENLQFGASLHLRCMGVELGMGWVGLGQLFCYFTAPNPMSSLNSMRVRLLHVH